MSEYDDWDVDYDYEDYNPDDEGEICPKDDTEMIVKESYVYDVVNPGYHEVSEITIWICPICGRETRTSQDLRSYSF